MKCWASTLFLLATLAGLYGFADVAGAMGWVARLLSVVFSVFAIGIMTMALRQHHRPPS